MPRNTAVSEQKDERRRAQLLTTYIDLLEVLEGNVDLPLGDQPLSVTGSLGNIYVTCMNYGSDVEAENWQVAAFRDGASVDTRVGTYLGTVSADPRWPTILAHVFAFRRK